MAPDVLKNYSKRKTLLTWRRLLKSKAFRRKGIRYGAIALNAALIVAAVFVVVNNHYKQPINNTAAIFTASQSAGNPLDQLSASDIAVSIADTANLPEAVAVRDQAETVSAELAVPPAEDVVAAKPQVVATALKDNQDIQLYTVQSGDSVGSLASRFDVTSDSIMWSNNLSSGTLTPGTKIYIPPINGIVYKVKSGDTPQNLAQTYGANPQQIISFNNAELTGLKPGELIVIPNGQVQPAETDYSYYGGGAFSTYSFAASYGSNGTCYYNGRNYPDFGYACGFCTWYAAWQSGAPSNWGNATSWAYYASVTPGWIVSKTPKVGAIVQTTAGDHVGIVDAVSGSMMKYSDMNGLAGYGAVGYSGWVSSADGFDGGMSDTVYIYR